MPSKTHSKKLEIRPATPERKPGWGADGTFAGLMGALLALGLLKFGNPVIFDRMIEPPKDLLELLFQPWPIRWGYFLLVVALIPGLKILKANPLHLRYFLVLPLIWLGWNCLASFWSIDTSLSKPTILHFSTCLLCFYAGCFSLSQARRLFPFWLALLIGFVLVLWSGFEQYYGGLEATRRYFYEQPNWQQYPPEYLKKIASNRIFSTLVYPNALAGAILLMLPLMLSVTWRTTEALGRIVQRVISGLVLYASIACLVWSGSKAGWLIALLIGMVVLAAQRISPRLKWFVAVALVLIGLTGFFLKFAPYFRKGATSVSARLDYWSAAFATAKKHPVFGTGPGTFAIPYGRIKSPDAEMARLVHNDYLEQASDSGLIGFSSYTAFIISGLWLTGRRAKSNRTPHFFPAWLGLFGWTLQGLVEFTLYIPAIAWPAFTLLGWLCGMRDDTNEIDNRSPPDSLKAIR